MSEEYSERFDELRKNRVEVSYHKYGPARKNYKPVTCRHFRPWNGVLRNIILPETQNISWMQQITSCSSLCTRSILKRTLKPQTAKIAPG